MSTRRLRSNPLPPVPTMNDEVTEQLQIALAVFFSNNRQPHMSGDARKRLLPHQMRTLEDVVKVFTEFRDKELATLKATNSERVRKLRNAVRNSAEMLDLCKHQFRHYRRIHEAKGGVEKAKVNADFETKCGLAYSHAMETLEQTI